MNSEKNPSAMSGNLYVVSTPIGNLEDITLRALRILKEVSIIAAEDTRRTQKLCSHFQIFTPLTSYHDFNKEEKTKVLIKRMTDGMSVALVSDAGTPLISDPGYYLVTKAILEGITVIPIPGSSAILAALTVSGLPTDAFLFLGFLPRKSNARLRALEGLQDEVRTIIIFESPHRVIKTLEEVKKKFSNRRIVVAREVTKTYEEFLRGSAEELLEVCRHRNLKGEITLLIEGKHKKSTRGSEFKRHYE